MQGVGFRPLVYRLAHELDLVGWVNNDPGGVTIEIEGEATALERFVARLSDERPAASVIESIQREEREPCGDETFRILVSATGGAKTVQVLPDIATCADCERELNDPADRRHGYPFLNCTPVRPTLQHRAVTTLRPATHDDERLPDV